MQKILPHIEKVRLDSLPVDIYSRLRSFPYSFFLDSALVSKKLGSFSFIGIEPFLIFKSKNSRITLDWSLRRETLRGNPFFALKKLFKRFKIDSQEFPFPFIGGGVGYFGYDLKDFNECLPDRASDDINIPDSIVCFYDCILVFDHYKNEFYIVSSGFPERGEKRIYRSKARLEKLKNRILAAKNAPSPPFNRTQKPVGTWYNDARFESNFTKSSYIKAVEEAKKYIISGDIYQVNLSQRFKTDLESDAFYLYRILRTINPASFASFLNFAPVQILSASPERFLKKKDCTIETRPIKGTRPRGNNPKEDTRLRRELAKSKKDNAENLMIIDLERNDLGRISEYGSVYVTEFMTCEEYATVFHLVSEVRGRLKNKIDAMDCLINCFPGGSITGAPKIRSMEIIEELEPVKRAVYTGSIGYISFNGNMDTSIVIRTLLVKEKSLYFHVGGGIVYDSDPEKEYEETLHKAKALIEAIEFAAPCLQTFRRRKTTLL